MAIRYNADPDAVNKFLETAPEHRLDEAAARLALDKLDAELQLHAANKAAAELITKIEEMQQEKVSH